MTEYTDYRIKQLKNEQRKRELKLLESIANSLKLVVFAIYGYAIGYILMGLIKGFLL